jgi:hypothetical protein
MQGGAKRQGGWNVQTHIWQASDGPHFLQTLARSFPGNQLLALAVFPDCAAPAHRVQLGSWIRNTLFTFWRLTPP